MTSKNIDINKAIKNTMAIVLAGGRGTRLTELSQSRSKPATPFAGKFRIIDFPLSNCINSGIRRVGVVTQYKAHTLIQHIQKGWSFLRAELNEFVEIWPAQQQTYTESWYKGTADAVFQNINIIKGHDPQYVLILAGDHVSKQDYGRLIIHHIQSGADMTVSCIEVSREEAKGLGVVDVDGEGNIRGYWEKLGEPLTIPGHKDTCFASMGIYVFNAEFLYEQLRRDRKLEGSTNDFGNDIIPYLLGRYKLVAHRFSDSCVLSGEKAKPYWRDIGTADGYWKANIDMVAVTPALNLYDKNWPIWTHQAQLPAAKFVFDDDGRRGMAIDSLVASGCIISGGDVRRSLLFNNVRVNSYCVIKDSVILPDAQIGRNARLKKTVVDVGCQIPEGMVIGEDEKLDAQRFHVTKGGIVLVSKFMLEGHEAR